MIRNGLRNITYSALAGVLLVFATLNCQPAFGEVDQATYNWLTQMGGVRFDQAGAAYLPPGVLQAIQQQRVPDELVFSTQLRMMVAAVEEALMNTPAMDDSVVKADRIMEQNSCTIQKAFHQAILVGLLAQVRGGGFAGSQQQMQQLALQFVAAFQNDSCGGQGLAQDPLFFQLISSIR